MRCAFVLPALLAIACGGADPLPPDVPSAPGTGVRPVPISVESTAVQHPPIPTPRDTVVDILHGVKVADPYRWLENDTSPRVARWVEAQNQLTARTLGAVPARADIHAQLEDLLAIGDLTAPTLRRTAPGHMRYFYQRREGTQNQPVLYVRDGLDGQDRALINPNAMNAAGTLALDWYFPSHDGALLAYGTSGEGSENSTLRIRNVATGKDLPDAISRTRYGSVCWKHDGRSFYYARYPAPDSVPAGEETYHRKIYEHVLGRPPDKDPLVFGAGRKLTDFPSCAISPDGRWLVVRVSEGWSKNEIFIADTTAPRMTFTELTSGKNNLYDALPLNERIYIRTNDGAPRYALYAVDPTHPARADWQLVIPEHQSDVLDSAEVIGGQILTEYLHAAVSRLERFDRDGKSLGAVALPGIGSSGGFSGLHDGDEAFFDFESFVAPTSIHRLDLATGKQAVWQAVQADVDPAEFIVTPGSARSKDGTRVPYLMVSRKDVDLRARDNPTLLYGYGGFNVSLQPRFTRTAYVLLDRGGVYVQANLRGGGEFGEAWHRAGERANKQHVFDDFVAVARNLVARKVTNPEHLAIYGRSNGGLLVAASVVQAPRLFRAAVSSVPLTDMVRYDRFLIAKLWVPEYGSPEDPEQFRWLYAYSPYHHVRKGTAYPAVLLTTAASDARVAPMHAQKMAAALQWATSSDRPVLLRTDHAAGHGVGKPISKVADEYTDLYSFVLWQLGVIDGPVDEP